MLDGKEFPNALPELVAAEDRDGYDYFQGRQPLKDSRQRERRVWFLHEGLPGATIVYDRAIGEGTTKLEIVLRLGSGLTPSLDAERNRFSVDSTDTLAGMVAMIQAADSDSPLDLSTHDGLPNFEGKPTAVICGYGYPELPQAVWTVFLPVAPGDSAPAETISLTNRPDGSVSFSLPKNDSTLRVSIHPDGKLSW